MIDQVAQYGIQFGAIVAGAMSLAEWATMPVGRTSTEKGRGTRKRWNALIYSVALGALGWEASLVELPGESRLEAYAGVLVLAVVATGAAHLVHAAKTAASKKEPKP